jgi:hypothetical protein
MATAFAPDRSRRQLTPTRRRPLRDPRSTISRRSRSDPARLRMEELVREGITAASPSSWRAPPLPQTCKDCPDETTAGKIGDLARMARPRHRRRHPRQQPVGSCRRSCRAAPATFRWRCRRTSARQVPAHRADRRRAEPRPAQGRPPEPHPACYKAAQDGLLPDGREAALVTFNTRKQDRGRQWETMKQVQYMPMVYGLRKKILQSGDVVALEVGVVYKIEKENGYFRYEVGTEPPLNHAPMLDIPDEEATDDKIIARLLDRDHEGRDQVLRGHAPQRNQQGPADEPDRRARPDRQVGTTRTASRRATRSRPRGRGSIGSPKWRRRP